MDHIRPGNTRPEHDRPTTTATGLVRDLLAFQAKLLLDGLKDVVLIHLSIAAALLDVLRMKLDDQEPAYFYYILEVGERFDLWLNLYEPTDETAEGAPRSNADNFLEKIEAAMGRA